MAQTSQATPDPAASRPSPGANQPPPGLDERTESLRAAYDTVRHLTEALAAPLSPEDQTVQTMPDVSPTKWHRGHTSWFFETFLLSRELPDYDVVHPAYGYLFNSYYETLGARQPRPERGHLSRPSAAEVGAYRRCIDAAMGSLLEHRLSPEVLDLVELGIHHEQQHQELVLMDIKHVLSRNPLQPSYTQHPTPTTTGSPVRELEAPKPRWIEHDGGTVEIGHGGPGFAFDNEGPRHEVHLVPFAVSDRLVTSGEWSEFVDDGGYARPELWLSDGWATVRELGWTAPLYWERVAAGGTVFTLFGPRPLDPREPVAHVSYYEADAFARWSGARLPTEAEWETAAGSAMASPADAVYGFHPVGASRDPEGASTDPGFFGQVWQWTSSSYNAYPGFRPAAGAVGEYNGKFMVNQQVLRGSACVTPPRHARTTYRNFFPAGARWAFSGVRLARDL